MFVKSENGLDVFFCTVTCDFSKRWFLFNAFGPCGESQVGACLIWKGEKGGGGCYLYNVLAFFRLTCGLDIMPVILLAAELLLFERQAEMIN